jgi:multiple sugar transport system ATP-binding protein
MVVELQVSSLVKRLGDHLAVDDVSFTVAEGDLLVLLGTSGSGKTTIMRMICGLEHPDSGQIVIAGRDVTKAPPRERNVGMVFQEYGLYPSMDVYGNLAYGLEARGGTDRAEIERRVRDAAERLGLTAFLHQSIVDLSGGEQQRVALGRAMVKDADAYLFDEPLSNLDPKLRFRMRRDILDMHRSKGKPTVYVTHDQSEAFAMADSIAVLSQGRVQQIGKPDELVEQPANTFVARFVGSPPMNLIPARLSEDTGRRQVDFAGASLPLPPHWGAHLAGYDKADVLVGFRPEEVRRTGASGATDRFGTISAAVDAVEPLIGETVVHLRVSDDTRLAAVFRNGDGDDLAPGQPLDVTLSGEHIRMFDPVTEKAIAP